MTDHPSFSPHERAAILEVLGKVERTKPQWKKLLEERRGLSDQDLLELVNKVETLMLDEEKQQKKNAKTVMDTWDIESTLCNAAERGDIDMMRYLIEEKGISVNDMGAMNTTPLIVAINKEQIKAIQLLLSHPDTDVNYVSGGGNTPLMIACRLGNPKIVNMLLDCPRTDVNKQSPHGATALHNAAGMGHMDIVERLLLVPHIELSSNYTEMKYSAISIANKNGHNNIARIIDEWQNPNNTQRHKMTP